MSSGMKLRSTIRPPERYGESEAETPTAALLQSMRRAREQSTDAQSQAPTESVPSPDQSYSRRPRPKPRIVQYDPTLPPAAFPTLSEPVPSRAHQTASNGLNGTLGQSQDGNMDSAVQPAKVEFDDGLGHIPMDGVENYVVSNTEKNQVYVGNMAAMAGADQSDTEQTLAVEDSDMDEPVDASEALGAKASATPGIEIKHQSLVMDIVNRKLVIDQIPNPTWDDLNPALQVEIIENMLKTENWRSICGKLGLKADDRRKVHSYLDIRNKQIRRENKQLARMRDSQLRALMRIDNSDVKCNNVPHQLVLRKLTRKTTRKLLESEYTDLLMCQAADVLAARQYLHQRELPRDLAGDWGQSLVVLREPAEVSSLGPEKFEWKEHLSLEAEIACQRRPDGAGDEDCTGAKSNFLKNIGKGSTVNPRDIPLNKDDDEPFPDWDRYCRDSKLNPGAPSKRRDEGLICLNVGTEQAAQIQSYQDSQPPFPPTSLQSEPPPTISPLVLSSLPEPGEETPSKLPATPRAWANLNAICSGALLSSPEEPVTRSLGGCWSFNALDPAIGHARYMRQIEQAKREAEQRKRQAQPERERERLEERQGEERVRDATAISMLATSSDTVSNDVFVTDPTLPTLDDLFVDTASISFEDPIQTSVDELMTEFMDFEREELVQHYSGNDIPSDELPDDDEVMLIPTSDVESVL
ncbi:uncharacterized protein N7459_007245 [Penicillium hispanicum]|uniref:uncharacterized protein n=1 Tax=Penicillium hispanicum TaxID=1080232 RepID=UPI0025417625|nr:uncharacterized protein N7459_007245 [Penicillium hispanicum]KAJ5578281.1 hypothetical protein N7459_007245 [Penicillium hispanicum]